MRLETLGFGGPSFRKNTFRCQKEQAKSDRKFWFNLRKRKRKTFSIQDILACGYIVVRFNGLMTLCP